MLITAAHGSSPRACDDENVELLDGRILYAAEEGLPHATICARLARLLIEGIPASVGEVRVGNPFALSDLSEPSPTSSWRRVCRPATERRTRRPPRW